MEDAVSFADEIKANATRLNHELVKVKAWGMKVLLRGMTAEERQEMYGQVGTPPAVNAAPADKGKYQARIAAAAIIICARDPKDGQRAFDWNWLEWMMEQPAGLLDQLAGKAFDLSGLGVDALENAEKN